MPYRDLCVPCAQKLQREGKSVSVVAFGINQKVNCSECGRRRYGKTYNVSVTALHLRRKPNDPNHA